MSGGKGQRTNVGSTPRTARAPETLAQQVEPVRDREERESHRRGDDTRARVIREAAACIIEEGYAKASANRIAQRAGLTWGVVQYHFGDRAGLFSAVVLAGYEQFRACLDTPIIPEGPPQARIEAIVDAGWQAYQSPLSRASFEILINTRASRNDDPDHAAELIEMARGVHRLGARLLADGDGHATGRSVEGLLWAALRGFAMTNMFTPDDYDFASERQTLINVLSTFLQQAPAPARGQPPDRTHSGPAE